MQNAYPCFLLASSWCLCFTFRWWETISVLESAHISLNKSAGQTTFPPRSSASEGSVIARITTVRWHLLVSILKDTDSHIFYLLTHSCFQLMLPLWKKILFVFVFIIVFCFEDRVWLSTDTPASWPPKCWCSIKPGLTSLNLAKVFCSIVWYRTCHTVYNSFDIIKNHLELGGGSARL